MGVDLRNSPYNPTAAFNLFKYTADNFTALGSIADAVDGDFAYVFNSQGTAWLPGTLGGTYYPSGFYVYNGVTWQIDKTMEAIAQQLDVNIDNITDLENTKLDSVVAGTNVTIDNTDQLNPIINAVGGDGGVNFNDSWSINGIYSTTSSLFQSVPEQIMIPHMVELMNGATKIEAKLLVSTENTLSSIGEVRVQNYTNGGSIPNSEVSLPNGSWSDKISTNWFDVTAFQGKAVRTQIRKVGGGGSTAIEGAALIYRISK